MSSNIPFTTQSNADASKRFERRKRGAKKYIGEWFQENVCKTNIKSTTSSTKIAKQSAQKLGSLCTTLEAWKLQHLNANLFCALDSLWRLLLKVQCWF